MAQPLRSFRPARPELHRPSRLLEPEARPWHRTETDVEDLTLALITLTSFVLLFVVAIFADRAGMEAADELTAAATPEPVAIPVEDSAVLAPRADVA